MRTQSTIVLGVLFLTLPLLSVAAEPAGGKTTAKDVSRKVGETGKAIKEYSVAQRDEAVKTAKGALDDVDARIARLERKLESEWERMDQAARKNARATMNKLRKERNQAAEWYGGLKHSSAEAWEQVRTGFVKSYGELRDSFARAGKEFKQ